MIDDRAAAVPGGIEDCRLFRWRGGWWFSASALLQITPFYHLQMVLCRLEEARIVECRAFASPVGSLIEKNWMPLVDGDDLKWIYRIDPMQIVTYRDAAEPGYSEQAPPDPPGPLHGWSGSSPVIRYGKRWLCVVHLRIWDGQRMFYEHAFVEMNDALRITRMSAPWSFEAHTVEFCAGLCLSGHDVILSYGVMDRSARLMRIGHWQLELLLRSDRVARAGIALSQMLRRRPHRSPG